MLSRFIVLLSLLVVPRVALAQGVTTMYIHLSDSIVLLPNGDSLEFQATGPAIVPNRPHGLLVTYYPFADLADTIRLRSIAFEFFRTLMPRLQPPPEWIVMRAVNVRALRRNQGGLYPMRAYGVVLERRSDGYWYPMNESQPIRFP